MLFDLSAIDERSRATAALNGSVPPDFTVIYHLLSFGRNKFIRIKVSLHGEYPSLPSICTFGKMQTGMKGGLPICSESGLKAIRTFGVY